MQQYSPKTCKHTLRCYTGVVSLRDLRDYFQDIVHDIDISFLNIMVNASPYVKKKRHE